MCGLLGCVTKKILPKNEFKTALETLSQRGPDAEGILTVKSNDANIYLGHKRLSIIDLSNAAKQPMTDLSGQYEIIFNGEIYNFYEVKKKLLAKGYIFKSKSDTEVLLYGYIEFGKNILNFVEGMFAFAIFNKNKNTIFLARDRFGEKPLYYYIDKHHFIFASELKAITSFNSFEPKKNELSIQKYLFYGYIPSKGTIFQNIFKLSPASYINFDIKTWKISVEKKYWDPTSIKLNNSIKEIEAIDRLDHLLKESVKNRLFSDVPVGIFLSGGVDSSLIAYYMKQFSTNVKSYTVSYEKYENSETFFASVVAKHLRIESNIKEFADKEVKDCFHEILQYLDEPMADPAILPLYFISKKAKPGITVALSGDGGDEIFGGYPKYNAQIFSEKLKLFKNIISPIFKISNNSIINKFGVGISLPFYIRQFIFGSGSFLPTEVEELTGIKINLESIFEDSLQYNNLYEQNDQINRSLYLDTRIQLPDWYLVKGDRASMAASLELRNPFLDRNLVEFAFSLCGSFKVKGLETKYLLKKLASKYIPKEIIYRQKKGFAVPLDYWLEKILEIHKFTPKSAWILSNFNLYYINDLKCKINQKNDIKYKLYRIYILDRILTSYEQKGF